MNAAATALKRRTQAERREEAERAILDAATRIVAAKGLDELTLADAGEAAGYSRGLPSHYFGSKAELLSAIAEYIREWFFNGLRDGSSRRPGLGNLIAAVEFYFDACTSDPVMWRTLHTLRAGALHKPSLAVTVARLNRDSARAIEVDIRAGMQNGEIRRDIDAAAYSVLTLAAAHGAISQWLVDPDHIDLPALRAAFIATLRCNLSPSEK
ncbi:MAG: TetR/AcrR family transcriptional regulator [bacterium]|nr:TetR/AcrR family transcriptional regulator [bacterium]